MRLEMNDYDRRKIIAKRFKRWSVFFADQEAIPIFAVGLQRTSTEAHMILASVDGMAMGKIRELLVDVIAKIDSLSKTGPSDEVERETLERIKAGLGESKLKFVCPTCGATGSAEEVRQYGRVVCPCGLPSAEGDD